MKKIFAMTLTLIIVITTLSGCMTPPNPSGHKEEQNTSKDENITESLKPPVPGEIIDLQINSIDKLNYYAAIRVLAGTPTPVKQNMTYGNYGISLLTFNFDTDETKKPTVPETTDQEETQGSPFTSNSPDTTEPEEEVYYYELDPNQPFFVNEVSMFQIELTDENGFLAAKLGLGIVDVVITKDCIWGDSLITFRNDENFFSCMSNGWGINEETGDGQWEFSTHKYVEGFYIVKNLEQENYSFYIDINLEGQVTAFECSESQNGGHRVDQNIKVVSSTIISNVGGCFTIEELENYFNGDNIL